MNYRSAIYKRLTGLVVMSGALLSICGFGEHKISPQNGGEQGEEHWERDKRWAPGHSFVDTEGLVKITALLPCNRDPKTHKLSPKLQASKEEVRTIRAYNRALDLLKKFTMPSTAEKIPIQGYDDVVTALMIAQSFSVERKGWLSQLVLRRVLESNSLGTDSFGSIVAADLLINEAGDFLKAKKLLKSSAKANPINRQLWLYYASKSESGSIDEGMKFDPLASPFTFEDAVQARKYILRMWPDHQKSLYFLAQDLDFLGRKKEAQQALQELEAIQISDPDLIRRRDGLRKYFDRGGFKRG